jgi:hypothetical protein
MKTRPADYGFTGPLGRKLAHLGLAALVLLLSAGCVLYAVWNITTRGLFEYVGIDYRLWYATAEIMRDHGLASVYDQYSRPNPFAMPFWPLPFPYLPLFASCLVLLLPFSPVTGFLLSTLLKTAIVLVYLWGLVRRTQPTRHSLPISLVLLSLPVFLNLLLAQMNVWLLIALGESLIALRRGKNWQAGLWLGGLLLKPQTLILLIPGLLIAKKWRVLGGFVVASAVVGILSLLLAGPAGLVGVYQVISQWPSILAESGMNWRALSLNLSLAWPGTEAIALVILLIGSLLTTTVALWLWLSRSGVEDSYILYLGTYAATCAVTWSSNVHMALPLLAPGVLLWVERKAPSWLVCLWLFVPTTLFLTMAFTQDPGTAHNVAGTSLLATNLGLLGWSWFSPREDGNRSQMR